MLLSPLRTEDNSWSRRIVPEDTFARLWSRCRELNGPSSEVPTGKLSVLCFSDLLHEMLKL
jgi:hypothetical protein